MSHSGTISGLGGPRFPTQPQPGVKPWSFVISQNWSHAGCIVGAQLTLPNGIQVMRHIAWVEVISLSPWVDSSGKTPESPSGVVRSQVHQKPSVPRGVPLLWSL